MTNLENSMNFHDFDYDKSKQIFEQVVAIVINLKEWDLKVIKDRETIEEIIQRKKEGKNIDNLYDQECDIVKTNGSDTLSRVFRFSNKPSSMRVQQILSMNEIFNVLSELHMSILPVLGLDKSLEKLNECYIEPAFIRAFLKSCENCKTYYKFSSRPCTQGCKKECELAIFDISHKDNDFCKMLLCLDRNTNFVWLRPLKSNKHEEVALELLTIICDFGMPDAFYSQEIEYFLEVIDILKKLKLPFKFPRFYTHCKRIRKCQHHIEGLMKSWIESVNENWLIGAHCIQWLMNTNNAKFLNSYTSSRVREAEIQSPYHAMFGLLPNEDLLDSKFISKSSSKAITSSKITVICSDCNKPIYKVYKCHFCKAACHITCCVRTVVKKDVVKKDKTSPFLISKCRLCVNDIGSKKFVDRLNKSMYS